MFHRPVIRLSLSRADSTTDPTALRTSLNRKNGWQAFPINWKNTRRLLTRLWQTMNSLKSSTIICPRMTSISSEWETGFGFWRKGSGGGRVGFPLNPIEEKYYVYSYLSAWWIPLFEAALLSKLKTIELDNTHPLHKFVVVNSSGRIRQLKSNTKRCRLSFLPSVISCFNKCFTR